jgi:hypothetical protein
MTYNGWTNRATWNVNLWVDNTERTYRARLDAFRRQKPTAATAEAFARQMFPNGTPDIRGFAAVNWAELAESWGEDTGPELPRTIGPGWSDDPVEKAAQIAEQERIVSEVAEIAEQLGDPALDG